LAFAEKYTETSLRVLYSTKNRKLYSKENDVVKINGDNNSNENYNSKTLIYIDIKSNESEWHQIPRQLMDSISGLLSTSILCPKANVEAEQLKVKIK